MNTLDFVSNSDGEFCLRDLKTTFIQFQDGNDWSVRIFHDGRVEINEDHTMDEAAQKFWECVINAAPNFFDQTPSEFERLCGCSS
ncbi:hypothetical protein [Sinorhizobium meliloti]|uniref:hypothetical protein n=1 Tax=Rhizobium meliloti TaxID=382 RepID=UPI000FD8F311|nr:hypothetical protein [Sinorhizobium meliloti]RVG88699.1 hypothetical protein CN219_03780 [Sinorhizobium meliloti]RVI39019.1 hypothetical protein CN197_02455 [Sinorhizobium meliloti]RVI46654.1 hypothetical protein CN196_09305 [Sinorhizobium meliloti]RVJ25656.1 hypothetical protein CN177_13345 [Sinorhizobium meliloti]RVK02265.1 hypothetical protein CN170_08785 [Sinorhizobium meliloti]